MSSIRIIATPPGELAPQAIREQWVGVVIPLASADQLKKAPPVARVGYQNAEGYIVLRSEAVAALRDAGCTEAVEFWEEYLSAPYLMFTRGVCVVID